MLVHFEWFLHISNTETVYLMKIKVLTEVRNN